MRKIAASFLAASSIGLFGCSYPEVADQPCEAINSKGDNVRPNTYPLGLVAVNYREMTPQFGGLATVEGKAVLGTVLEKNGGYIIDVKDFPEKVKFGNSTRDSFAGKDVALVISTIQTGTLGLTTGCIERGVVDPNGIPTNFIHLPS